MAAALHLPRNDNPPNVHPAIYPQPLIPDIDQREHRYPSITPSISRRSTRLSSPPDLSDKQPQLLSVHNARSIDTQHSPSEQQQLFASQQQSQGSTSQGMLSVPSQSPEPFRGTLSYALPSGAARRVVERYSLDESERRPSGSAETRQTLADLPPSPAGSPQPTRKPTNPQDRPQSMIPSSPLHPSLPAAGVGSNSPAVTNAGQFPPIMPLSASPNYTPPIAPRNRTYPQQPTYINPSTSTKPVYPPKRPPQEEVCVECAMRDQDMADVDVTSPGVWERASDAAFEDLKQLELDEEASGIVNNDPKRPRIRGGRLTEQNVRVWLSINPKEPAARQQTVNKYVKSQRALLKEEASARAQALQEAKQLDNKVRDAYTQLRTSAYDLGNHAAIADETGGVRIKPPLISPSGHHPTHSREITLLENGMIVEHVDVRKEEREAKERRRKEERRARKSSRSSAVEVTSIISANSNGRHTDNGASLKPYSRYSQSSSARPISILTAPHERPELPRAYSQASFSDVHSLGSTSPKRRFFGFRNLSTGWRSQESLAPSAMTGGSMLDMHVALQRESNRARYLSGSPVDLNSPRRSQIWPEPEPDMSVSPNKTKSDSSKKMNRLKFWKKWTGNSKNDTPIASDSRSSKEKMDDDYPLAPPPPRSLLFERGSPEMTHSGPRQNSTPSLSSVPKFNFGSPGMSPPTAPSSTLPSPVSLRPPGPGLDIAEIRNSSNGRYDDVDVLRQDDPDNNIPKQNEVVKVLHPTLSTPDMRHASVMRSLSPLPPLPTMPVYQPQSASLASREKSLPPIPLGEEPATPIRGSDRPKTVYTYDPQPLPPGTGPAHTFLPPNAAFRSGDVRRQSFCALSSQPNLTSQTLPANYDPRISFSPQYNEFGTSRRSLGRFDLLQSTPASLPPKEQKRKSKFFSAILGKKHNKSQDLHHEQSAYLFPTTGDASVEEWNAYTLSSNRQDGFNPVSNPHPNPRMSVTSRKAIEELVSQDTNFVAYRYPSKDQQLNLFR